MKPLILSPSPFHLEESWAIRCENKKHNCTLLELDTFVAKGLINTIDFKILEMLATYPFINTYNLEFALSTQLSSIYQKENYARNLRKLVKIGALLKYCIIDNDSEHPNAVVSPFRFYRLSPGAYRYMYNITHLPHNCHAKLLDFQIMELLSITQLLIHTASFYQNSIKKQFFSIQKAIGKHYMSIPAHILLQANKKNIRMFIFSCRSNSSSKEHLCKNVKLLFRWLDCNDDPLTPCMILIICETLHEIPNLHRFLDTFSTEHFKHPVYYALDTNLLTTPLFECIYQYVEKNSIPVIERIHFNIKNNE